MRPTDSRAALLLTAALDPRHPFAELREAARARVRSALRATSTVAEAAAELGVGKSSLKRWIQAEPSLDPARRTIDAA
jgi:transposase-like protein